MECARCGAPFKRSPRTARFCSRRCYLFAGWERQHAFKSKFCAVCGTLCDSRRRKYCSRQCLDLARSKGWRTKTCDWCGRGFRSASANNPFCSRMCKAEWQSQLSQLQDAKIRPYFGSRVLYSIGWDRARHACLERASGYCEKCRQLKPLEVHHRLPLRHFRRASDAHDLENLLALCFQCHRAEHRKLKCVLRPLALIPFAAR